MTTNSRFWTTLDRDGILRRSDGDDFTSAHEKEKGCTGRFGATIEMVGRQAIVFA